MGSPNTGLAAWGPDVDALTQDILDMLWRSQVAALRRIDCVRFVNRGGQQLIRLGARLLDATSQKAMVQIDSGIATDSVYDSTIARAEFMGNDKLILVSPVTDGPHAAGSGIWLDNLDVVTGVEITTVAPVTVERSHG